MQRELKAKKKELIARDRARRAKALEDARKQEELNPLSLAEMFRFLLFFINVQLVEDPQPDSPVNLPYPKGLWANKMLTSVYQTYCKETQAGAQQGFMSSRDFATFLEESAILMTHVPRNGQC